MKRFLEPCMTLLRFKCIKVWGGIQMRKGRMSFKKTIVCAVLLCALLFSGCAASTMEYAADAEAPAMMAEPESMMVYTSLDKASSLTSGEFGGHKVIQNFDLRFETDCFDEDIAYINERLEAAGGYAETSSLSGKKPETYQDRGRNAYLVLRIPSNNVRGFFEDLKRDVGTLLSSDQHGDDITEQYFDTETRLSVLQTQHERLTSILVETDNLADIIALENEIARVTLEIESLTTELRRWDNLVNYATVTINLNELAPKQGPATSKNMGARMEDGFKSTLNGMGVFLENLLVFLVSALPVLIPLAVIALIVIFFIRRGKKMRTAQAAARAESPKKPENP